MATVVKSALVADCNAGCLESWVAKQRKDVYCFHLAYYLAWLAEKLAGGEIARHLDTWVAEEALDHLANHLEDKDLQGDGAVNVEEVPGETHLC